MSDAFEEPFVEVDRDRHGRYKLPVPGHPESGVIPWTRATTLARTLSDEYMLNQWRIRQVVFGIGQRQDLFALAASAHPDDRNTLQSIGDQAQAAAESDKGANLGRALHAFTQRLDGRGVPDGTPDMYRPYLRAYASAMRAAGFEIQPQLIERIVACPEIRTAGQFDRLLLPSGVPDSPTTRYVVGDLKTAKLDSITFAWLEIAIQLSVYAHSPVMWNHEKQKYEAMPPVDLEYAIVMHLPQDLPPDQARCDIYRVDILKGWEFALLAGRVREARQQMKHLARCLYREGPSPKPYLPPLAERVLAEKVEEMRATPESKTFGVVMREIETAVGTPPEQVQSVADGVLQMATPVTPFDRVRAASGREELSALWREGSAAGWWSEELALAGKERLRELGL